MRRFLVAVVGVVLLLEVVTGASGFGAAAGVPRGKIAFVRFSVQVGHPRIYSLTLGQKAPRLLGLPAPGAEAPAWSWDGRRLAFVVGKNPPGARDIAGKVNLYVSNAHGGALRLLTRRAARVGAPAWSPDVRRVVVVRSAARGNGSSLWIVRVASGRATRITHGSIDLEPSWAPHGGTIAFLRVDPKTYRGAIWEVQANGSGLRRMPLENVSEPVWSPDGSRLLVHDSGAIYTVLPDGTDRKTVVTLAHDRQGAVEDPQPSWSPDGRWIAFCQLGDKPVEGSSIWIVRVDGSGLRRVSGSADFDTDPSWAP